MKFSVGLGILLLFLKCYAYWLTGSAAILSDAAESVVHILAVGFAAFSLSFSMKPADVNHTYGHDRIAFFSAGFEGALILLAGIYILISSVRKFIEGVEISHIDLGMICIAIAAVLNGFLGTYLVRLGKTYHSIVLEADGKHLLTDCLTSFGVIIALFLTHLTGWLFLDPLIAFLIGCNILWTGFKLMQNSIGGLMDQADPLIDQQIRDLLDKETAKLGIQYHHLRHRNAGNRLLIEIHLLFPQAQSIYEAHHLATELEKNMEKKFHQPIEIVSHLEPLETHDEIHEKILGRKG